MILDEIDQFPCSIQTAKFLKSKDRIAYCGNQLNDIAQVSIARHVDDVTSIEASYTFDGHCDDMSICELHNGIVLATTQNNENGFGNLILCTARSDPMGYSEINFIGDDVLQIQQIASELMNKNDLNNTEALCYCSYINTLAFDDYNHILALGNDHGSIVLNDMNTGQITNQFIGDSSGIVKLGYQHASTLISTSHSTGNGMSIWDVRIANSKVTAVNYPLETKFYLEEASPRVHLDRYYSSIDVHALNNTIVCGTAAGDIVLWDHRNTSKPVSRFDGIHSDIGKISTYLPLGGAKDASFTSFYFLCSH